MIPVGGDVSLLGLGLSDKDIQMMRDVSVIFHVAASVRFDDPLKDAILMNTRGTREVMRLGKSLRKLCVLMHVSTTYSNPDRYVIEEKVTDSSRCKIRYVTNYNAGFFLRFFHRTRIGAIRSSSANK